MASRFFKFGFVNQSHSYTKRHSSRPWIDIAPGDGLLRPEWGVVNINPGGTGLILNNIDMIG
jgi:hypothetical protein